MCEESHPKKSNLPQRMIFIAFKKSYFDLSTGKEVGTVEKGQNPPTKLNKSDNKELVKPITGQ